MDHQLIKTLAECEPESLYPEMPVVWDKAEGHLVTDINGKEYIDFTSGILVANVGHSHPRVVEAIREQAEMLLHCYIFPNESRARLVEKLVKITGMEKVLLTVTGSEANDAVIQMMLRRKPKTKILAIRGAYYGSTLGCRNLCAEIDESVTPKRFSPEEVGGLFLQVFRGEDVRFMPYDWVRQWVEWAQINGIPAGFDEIQSGFGRTGRWFGYNIYDIKPNFITISKALGGGLPISAVVGEADLLSYSDDLWSTFSGNPICCAGALANLKVLEEQRLIQRACHIGATIEQKLAAICRAFRLPLPRGRGMVWILEIGNEALIDKIIDKAIEKGLLLIKTRVGIKLAPPLIIPHEAVSEGIYILSEAIKESL